ncbi:MAG: glutamate--cysteine ligase, partial [Steroidobacter sp.]
IRPKRVVRSGERPTQALKRAGVEYVEVRALDVSAFDPVGVNQNKLRFLEAFLALCVLKESPLINPSDDAVLDDNHVLVAHRGRELGLTLNRNGHPSGLRDWSLELLDSMQGICELLDHNDNRKPYTAALEIQRAKVLDVALTPSARTLVELNSSEQSFAEFALQMSMSHKAYLLDLYPPNERRLEEFRVEAETSLQRREAIEKADTLSFDEFLAKYFAA